MPDALTEKLISNQGEFSLGRQVCSIDIVNRKVTVADGAVYSYQELIWTGDQNRLYQIAQSDDYPNQLRRSIETKQQFLQTKKAADSILSFSLLVDSHPETFAEPCGVHCFYTPRFSGLSTVPLTQIQEKNQTFICDWDLIVKWVKQYLERTTYEISIPALRDPSLAPVGKTAILVSTLFDYELTAHIQALGKYEEFKEVSAQAMLVELNQGILKGISPDVIEIITATPLTIERVTDSTQGSLTGWSFANHPFPAEVRFTRVRKSAENVLPHVSQAGQWTFNPAGIPVAVLTGRIAADRALRNLKKKRQK